MLISSIDIMGGQAVQLRQGKTLVLEAGDPRVLARRFAPLGEVAVIDLDAALGRGSNASLIRELLPLARCRVGGGIRDVAAARSWLDAGACKVILGTAATPQILSQLPRERTIAALDARDGEVVVEGWVRGTGRGVLERIEELKQWVGGFLVTFVEIEGTLAGLDAAAVKPMVAAAGAGSRITAAGGVRSAAEVGLLDAAGADAQVGMAIYRGLMDIADAYAACLRSDRPDGLWPTVVVDELGSALGLAYSSHESLRASVQEGRGIYFSRSRNGLWRKGETSGAAQRLLAIDADCDRDALRFTVAQQGSGFCHLAMRGCWDQFVTGRHGLGLGGLERRLAEAEGGSDSGSYTARLLREPGLLGKKIVEEAHELVAATEKMEVVAEAADVFYFACVRLLQAGVSVADVISELDRRALKLSRRAGDAKPAKGQENDGYAATT